MTLDIKFSRNYHFPKIYWTSHGFSETQTVSAIKRETLGWTNNVSIWSFCELNFGKVFYSPRKACIWGEGNKRSVKRSQASSPGWLHWGCPEQAKSSNTWCAWCVEVIYTPDLATWLEETPAGLDNTYLRPQFASVRTSPSGAGERTRSCLRPRPCHMHLGTPSSSHGLWHRLLTRAKQMKTTTVWKGWATAEALRLPEVTVKVRNWDGITWPTSPPTDSGSGIPEAEIL